MALWIKKRFSSGDNWAATDLMDLGEELLMRFPDQFMIVQERHRGLDTTIWVRVPLPEMRDLFPGFTEGDIGELKTQPTKLAVEEGAYAQAFGSLPLVMQ